MSDKKNEGVWDCENDDALFLGEYDTEQEAAYAFNVGEVLLAPFNEKVPTLSELNTHLELTQQQVLNVETVVCKIMREQIGLPNDYRFPVVIKTFLKQTYVIKE